ncbi:MAG: cytochrome c [Phreatobacter sp.]|nr:cytochrome c [Phreatobacter sp.]
MRTLLIAACALAGLSTGTVAQQNSYAQVERGRYIAATGNCQGCHTIPGEAPYTGARAMQTPFGTIYAPNITFADRTGIARWTKDDFWRAMHEGIGRDGSRLYPAFPYPHFTKMPRQDVDAVYDYLASLPRVERETPANRLPFPLSWRRTLAGWNLMFFTPGVYQPDPSRSEEWNRGAYLVEGPGHCGACHTPKNLAGADNRSRHLQGGEIDNWAAPDIRAGRHGGISHWSDAEIVEYLKTGRNAHTAAFSSMAEVIAYSTQLMTDADLSAMAVYLRSLDSPARSPAAPPAPGVMAAGRAIYADNCSACHRSDGSGVPRLFGPLAGSNKVKDPNPTTLIRIVLEGARSVPTQARPTPLSMPAYNWKLTDAQIAAVLSFVRSNWGNAAPPVTEDSVRSLRQTLRQTAVH